MFHRPLATVLSSVSIRSLLPTRLFCAPATAIDDAITTVRTTGIRSIRDGSNHSEYGVYWGKDDPRNMLMERNSGMVNYSGTEMRPIMMALEQAKKNGLKKIRVQTDSEINKTIIRNEAQTFKNVDISLKNDAEFPKYVYCERIAKIMDEMEVILEHRPHGLETGNEVIALLNEDTNKRNLENDTSYAVHPDYEAIWGITPENELSLQRSAVSSDFSERSTVRTTVMISKNSGRHQKKIGIYWGEGDPRNTKFILKQCTSFAIASKMQSILMALDQAKKIGLKRIRVQSDLKMNEFSIRRAVEVFNNTDLTLVTEHDLLKFVYCDRIVKIMDEIEVILDNRSAWVNGTNDVFRLLNQDKGNKNQTPEMSILSPDYKSDWTITPSEASPLEGRIVPTVYVTALVHIANRIGVSASHWAPESIEHLDINQRPVGSVQRLSMNIVTHFRAQLKAIHNVIKEAREKGLSEIQLVTDSLDFLHFYESAWKKRDGRTMPNEKLYLDIKALTDLSKVHFKGVRLAKNCQDKQIMKVYEMANEGLSTLSAPASPDSNAWENHPKQDICVLESATESIVRTTGFRSIKQGHRHRLIGVYWGEGDPRNMIEIESRDLTDCHTLRLRALLIALEQAITSRLLRVRVQTDRKINEFEIRMEARKFNNLNPQRKWDLNVKYSKLRYCDRIANIMDEIEVILEHQNPWNAHRNEVIELLENGRKANGLDLSVSLDSQSDWTITPKEASPLDGRIVPTVYASGRINDIESKNGVSACVWDSKSILNLEINRRPVGSNEFVSNKASPITIFQTRLIAIRSALEEARSVNLSEILVITDSLHFIHYFPKEWKRENGSAMTNKKLYLEIKALTETIKVHFKGVRHSEDLNDELKKKLSEKAKLTDEDSIRSPNCFY